MKLQALGPEISDFVLEHAVAYSELELKQAIARGAREAIAVVKRNPLSPALANLLTFHDDADVLVALAHNAFAELEMAAMLELLRRARSRAEERGDLRLAEALLERRPVRADYALLFLFARPDQRVEILLAAQRMQLGRPPGSPPSPSSAVLDELELTAVSRQPTRSSPRSPKRSTATRVSRSGSSRTCRASHWLSRSPRSALPTKSWCGC